MYGFSVIYTDGRRETISGSDFSKIARKQAEFVKKAIKRNSDIYIVEGVKATA